MGRNVRSGAKAVFAESLEGTKMHARLTARTLLILAALLATLCAAPRSQAGSGPEIDASVNATLTIFTKSGRRATSPTRLREFWCSPR